MPRSRDSLTVDQMKAALPRLKLRLRDLDEFDPTEVVSRHDPKVIVLQNAIGDFLTKTFGNRTAEYNRYSMASNLDTAGIVIGCPTALHDVIEGLQRGKKRAIAILEGLRIHFLEEIELASADPIENGARIPQVDSGISRGFCCPWERLWYTGLDCTFLRTTRFGAHYSG